LKVSETFCAYPFVHQHLQMNGKVSVCCYNPSSYQSSDHNLTHKNQFNSNIMNAIRKAMLEGKRHSACNHCYDLEDRGITSPRQIETSFWQEDHLVKSLEENIDITKRKLPLHPISHDIRFSNTCSLKCRTCIPSNSSAINAENHKFNFPTKTFPMFSAIENQNTNEVDSIPISEKTKWIYLVGGEPLVEEKNTNLLEKVSKLDIDPVIVINTSMARKNNKLKEVLKNFTKVNYIVSIDAYGKLNDYIRSGSQWENVVENLNSFDPKEIGGFNTVISMYNVHQITPIIEWVARNYPNKHHFISRAIDHKPTELQNVPHIMREKIINECLSLFSQYKHHGLQDIATFLSENNYSETGFQQFIEFTKELDQRRKESIIDAEPLWSPYFT